jgi:Ras GTPase-activating-like protein IQGAP2/3
MSIHEEIGCAPSVTTVVNGHPFYEGVIVHYVRPRQVTYVKDALQVVIQDMLEQEDLDLETDPLLVSDHFDALVLCSIINPQIYRNCINEEEMRTGRMSNKRKDVTFKEAVEDPDARPRFIRSR